MQARQSATLLDILDRILDKGVVINADITVLVAGVELLGIRIRAAVASFETAAHYGLQFPGGTNYSAIGWQQAGILPQGPPTALPAATAEEPGIIPAPEDPLPTDRRRRRNRDDRQRGSGQRGSRPGDGPPGNHS